LFKEKTTQKITIEENIDSINGGMKMPSANQDYSERNGKFFALFF